jgi:hypothetical protein
MNNFLIFTSLAATCAGSAICDQPELKVQGLTRTTQRPGMIIMLVWELVITKVERDGEDCVFHVTATQELVDEEENSTYRIPVSALSAPDRDIGELLRVAEVSEWRYEKNVDSNTFVDLYSKTKTDAALVEGLCTYLESRIYVDTMSNTTSKFVSGLKSIANDLESSGSSLQKLCPGLPGQSQVDAFFKSWDAFVKRTAVVEEKPPSPLPPATSSVAASPSAASSASTAPPVSPSSASTAPPVSPSSASTAKPVSPSSASTAPPVSPSSASTAPPATSAPATSTPEVPKKSLWWLWTLVIPGGVIALSFAAFFIFKATHN